MAWSTLTDPATALDAIRSQRAAASSALHELELYRQLEPRGECLADWVGGSSLAYSADLAAVLAMLAEVRSVLSDAIDTLWIAIGEASDD